MATISELHPSANMIGLLMLGIQVHLTSAQIGYYLGTKTTSKCFTEAGYPQLKLDKCRSNEIILIHQSFQGSSTEPGRCFYTRGDCVEYASPDIDTTLNRHCLGKSQCSVTVNVSWMPNCKAYSTYLYVIYQCVPKEEIIDVCQSQDKRAFRMGFLKTPHYPDQYSNDLECRCNITTDIEQKVLLKFLDSSVEWSEGCKKDVVKIIDGSSMMPRCGQLPRNYNITSQSHKVEVLFETDLWQRGKGFLMQLEALGSMHIKCSLLRPLLTAAATTPSQPPTTTAEPQETTQRPLVNTNSTSDDVTGSHVTSGATTENTQTDVLSEEYENYFEQSFFSEDISVPTVQVYPAGDADYAGFGRDTSRSRSNTAGPLVGIIIGCFLILVIIVVLIGMCVWLKRHRQKKDISRVPHDSYLAKIQKRHQGPPPTSPVHTPKLGDNTAQSSTGSASDYNSDFDKSAPTPDYSDTGKTLKKSKVKTTSG